MTDDSQQSHLLGLYIHIPFCIRKCQYCDFLSFPADEETRQKYVDALIREIRCRGKIMSDYSVDSVFFGGGTPTVLSVRQLRQILDAVSESFQMKKDPEISMEMNPGTDRSDLGELFDNGVNRVSIGLQSTEDRLLERLGRIHNRQTFMDTYHHLRDLHVENINIDLMNALPGQTLNGWEKTLRSVMAMKPEHISAYSLIIEEGTPFAEMAEQGKLDLPDEETERAMYHLAGDILAEGGYSRYEISNYAREGFKCRHNLRYWTGASYLGMGLGASSFLNHQRWKNTASMGQYLSQTFEQEAPRSQVCVDGIRYLIGDELIEEYQQLTSNDEMAEFMVTGLRLTEGVAGEEFLRRFGIELNDVYGGVLQRHVRSGLIRRTEQGVSLTKKGIDISNYVLSDFIL